ncbi:S1 RNA-binding domain-containing protein [Streptomyces bambusae]|uniref:S1 RNA-binding domain-containing protein n=1 Tax=Streptomyces bambusae TaxID=1550616 RepID=UPI001CFCC942|nr:S1 RNA-binding domain-containing protein [Streptomyces bambusae]MCB5166570.1 S1 RNA-binding domain-containing protein [Streptomyces bambusae]
MDWRSEKSELWAFLESLRSGETLGGTVSSIDSFGVFVALDRGPDHPLFPGVGFISMPELSWIRWESVSDVVRIGERIVCEFMAFDTWNLEARLSLRATRPDPFEEFARSVAPGQLLRGRVTKVVPIGVFVEVAEGVEGLVRELPVRDGVRVGDELTVVVGELDRARRRVTLACRG